MRWRLVHSLQHYDRRKELGDTLRRSWTLALTLSAVALLAVRLAAAAGSVHAQLPPARFFGALTIDGAPAPAGTQVVAMVGVIECGTATTTEEGRYVIDVASVATIEGCAADDTEVQFVVNGLPAAPTGRFQTGFFVALDLQADSSGQPAPPEPAPVEPLPLPLPGELPPVEPQPVPMEPAPEPVPMEPQPEPVPEEPQPEPVPMEPQPEPAPETPAE